MRKSVFAVSRRAVSTLKAMLIPGLALLLALVPAAVVNLAMPAPVSAAIALRGSATTGTTVDTNLTIGKPTGVVAGDVMIVNIAKVGNSTTAPSSSGWTLIDGTSLGGGGTKRYGAVLYRVADGTEEEADFTFALGPGTNSAVGAIVAFSGVDTSGATPFDVEHGAISVQDSNVPTVVATPITTASDNAAVIMFGMAAIWAPTWESWTTTLPVPPPLELDELYDSQIIDVGAASVGAAWATKTDAGDTGAGGATLSWSAPNGGILIALKPATSTELDVAAATGTYGGTASLTATLSPAAADKTINFTLNGTAVGSASTDSTGVAHISAASLSGIGCDTYPAGVGASFAGDAGFSDSSGTAALTVVARDITVTADEKSKVYGDADPALTYHISSGSLAAGDAFSGVLARAAGEDTGTYTIRRGTLALNSNYNLTFVESTFTINVRNIVVTADEKGKVYGDADPALAYHISSGSLAAGDAFSGNIARAAGEDAGTYTIRRGTLALNSNYNLTFVESTFTINVRNIVVKADDSDKVYGDADPALTYQISSGSLAASDAFSGKLARAAGEDPGKYAIQQGTLALSGNYNFTFVEGTFTISVGDTDTDETLTPIVDAISPQSGRPGDTLDVVIRGSNFTGATSVDFGPGVTVNHFDVKIPTRIIANITIDPAAELGDNNIVVTTPSGNSTSSAAFSIDLSAVTTGASGAGGLWLLLILVLLAIVGGFLLFAWLKRRKKRVEPELAPILAPSRPLGGTREAAEPARAPAADLEEALGEAAQAADLDQAPAAVAVDQPLEAMQEAVEAEQVPMVAAAVAADQPLEETEQGPTMAADQPPEEAEKPADVPLAAAAVSRPRRRTTKRKTTTSAASAPRKPTKRRKKATG